MKKTAAFLLILLIFSSLIPAGLAADSAVKTDTYYTVGSEENTFDTLYKKMCVNLDLHTHPFPEGDTIRNQGAYVFGEYEKTVILTNDEHAYEVIGTVFRKDGSEKYLLHRWIGYQENGDIIGMDVYYTLQGRYVGNIRHNYSDSTSLPSHRCPYMIPDEALMK